METPKTATPRKGKKVSDVMIGGPTPGGITPGISLPDQDKLQAMLEGWKRNVALIPPQNRYKYNVDVPLLMNDTEQRQQLGQQLNSYMPSPTGGSYFDEISGMEGGPDVGKYQELINQGLWKVLLKDKKDIDENDVQFIQNVNKFIKYPQVKENEAGK